MSDDDLEHLRTRHRSAMFENVKQKIGIQYFVQLCDDKGIRNLEA